MQTLKEIKEWFYEDISNRYLDFLWDEEKDIVENLQSEDNWTKFNWTKTEAVNIVFQALDGYQMNWNENTIWEAWYVRWYEVALMEFKNRCENIMKVDEAYRIKRIIEDLDYLLNN